MVEGPMNDLKWLLFLCADVEARKAGVDALKQNGFGREDGYFIVEHSNIEIGFQIIERDLHFRAVITAWRNPVNGRSAQFHGLKLLRKLRMHTNYHLRTLPVIVYSGDTRCRRTVERDYEHAAFVAEAKVSSLHDVLRGIIDKAPMPP